MMQTLEQIADNFSLFDDWEDRYRYLIDLGKALPPMEDSLKTDENKVRGCTSQVWMAARVEEGRFRFVADSDAFIVRGLVALLLAAYDGRPVEEIAAVDIEGFFHRIGLDQHLSPNRRSGFFAIVERIRAVPAAAQVPV